LVCVAYGVGGDQFRALLRELCLCRHWAQTAHEHDDGQTAKEAGVNALTRAI
jgi:hypothetical protein